MKKNFDQKIDEMLVVLNAVKKKKPNGGNCAACGDDPVTCAMNDALRALGFNVVSSTEAPEENPEDPMDGIEGAIDDLDLPRPADSDDSDDDPDDGSEEESDGETGEESGDELGGEDGDDGNGEDEDDGSDPFDPLGGVQDSDADDNAGVEDENDSEELKLKRIEGGDVVFSFGDAKITVSKQDLAQIVDFLNGDSGTDDSGFQKEESEDDGASGNFGQDESGDEDGDGEEDD